MSSSQPTVLPPRGLRTQIHSTFESAIRFRSAWDRISADVPVHGWSWFASWWDAFEDHNPWEKNQLALLTVTDTDNTLVGAAPMYICSQKSFRSLRFLGDGKATTDYLRILTEPGRETEVALAIADLIRSHQFTDRFGNLDLLVVDGHQRQEPSLQQLFQSLTDSGWRSQTAEIESSWLAPLPGDWETKLNLLGSQRRVVSRCKKRLKDGSIEIEMIDDPIHFDRNWNDFVRLHQLRRRSVGDPGCFDSPSFEQFLYGATRALFESGQARLVFASKEGVRFAAAYWLLSDSTIFVYQNGMDPQFKRLEPGHLLNTFLIQWGIENGMTQVDFLRGNEPYKKQWGAEPMPLYRTRLVAPTWSAKVKDMVWQTARKVKQTSRQWLKGSKPEVELVTETK